MQVAPTTSPDGEVKRAVYNGDGSISSTIAPSSCRLSLQALPVTHPRRPPGSINNLHSTIQLPRLACKSTGAARERRLHRGHGSTRASVLVVPFTGDPDFFELDPRPVRSRSGAGCMPGPFGRVTEDALHVELTNTTGLSPGDQAVETRLAPVRNHVESLRSALERLQADLRKVGLRALEHCREQAEARRGSLGSASLPVRRRDGTPPMFPAPPV